MRLSERERKGRVDGRDILGIGSGWSTRRREAEMERRAVAEGTKEARAWSNGDDDDNNNSRHLPQSIILSRLSPSLTALSNSALSSLTPIVPFT